MVIENQNMLDNREKYYSTEDAKNWKMISINKEQLMSIKKKF
jgi:hypothetical protein